MPDAGDLTDLLLAWNRGDAAAQSALMAAVYDDLRRVARRRLGAGRAGDTLTPTALVHETYLRLIDQRRVRWQNRAQFFAVAARLMRRVLIDHVRTRTAARRGGADGAVRLDSGMLTPQAPHALPLDLDMLALDDALARLKAFGPRHSALVELRFFGGLSIEEAAVVLKVSPATAKRDWALARAWLYRELGGREAGREGA
jgi:RNA polymerase sigma factor (TIGR02999 family)